MGDLLLADETGGSHEDARELARKARQRQNQRDCGDDESDPDFPHPEAIGTSADELYPGDAAYAASMPLAWSRAAISCRRAASARRKPSAA